MPIHVTLEIPAMISGVTLELLPVNTEIVAAQHHENEDGYDKPCKHDRRDRQEVRQPVSLLASQ